MRKNGILLFTETSDRGGMEIFSKTLLEGIIYSAKDVDFKIILLNNAFPPNIKLANQDSARLRFFCCASRFKIIRNIKFILFFIRNTLFRRPDFIIANHMWFQRIYWFLTPLIRVNYGFMVYGVEAWNLSFIDKIIIRRAKVIGSCSDYTRRKIYDQIGIRGNIMLFSPAVLGNK